MPTLLCFVFQVVANFFSALSIVGVGHLVAPASGLLGGSTTGFVNLVEALMIKAEELLSPSALAAKVLGKYFLFSLVTVSYCWL